jgi:hypothetical protein
MKCRWISLAHAALITDQNLGRIRDNECVSVDFLKTYGLLFSQGGESRSFSVNYHTVEELAEILIVLYGCDILAEEAKANPADEHQDGTIFMIWGDMGRKPDGSPKTIFDTLNSALLTITRMSPDERLYGTLEEALTSLDVARLVKEYGAEKINVQAFTLAGEDRGLFKLDGSLVDGIVE